MDGDLGHSSRLRDGGQHHMPSGATYGPFSSHVCTATMALAVRHDTAASGEGEAVNCPMPGTILSVNVNVGDTVTEGQILMILEAMKMENEIMAPKAGKVLSVGVQKGATVESGTLLCVIG